MGKMTSEDPYQVTSKRKTKSRSKTPRKKKEGLKKTESGFINPVSNIQMKQPARKPGTVYGGQGYSHVKGYHKKNEWSETGEHTVKNYLLDDKQSDLEIFVKSDYGKSKKNYKGLKSPPGPVNFNKNEGNIYTKSHKGTSKQTKSTNDQHANILDSEDDMPSAIINDENLAVHTAGVSPMKQKSRKYNDFSNPNFFANSK